MKIPFLYEHIVHHIKEKNKKEKGITVVKLAKYSLDNKKLKETNQKIKALEVQKERLEMALADLQPCFDKQVDRVLVF